ncbi:MAG: hypothetical protein PHH91_12740 [Desulfuromonadaceae bacterium]|nr:hypothetical protein [Desulfuromonadaceae bacterium]
MDIKTAITLVKQRYLVPTVVVIISLSGGMAYVWSEYKELLKQRVQLIAEQKKYTDEKSASEKHYSDAAIMLLERKAELDKREFVLQQLEKENQNRSTTLQQRAVAYSDAYNKLHQAQTNVSRDQRVKEAEEKIQRLMSEFSAMGVNLNDPVRCNDIEGLAKHNSAKTKYSEIYTVAEAYGLKEQFNNFLFHNGQSRFSPCQK